MRVLLVYQLMPEEVRFYLIEDATEGDVAFLERLHGKFLGAEGMEEYEADMEKLSDMLMEDPENCEDPSAAHCCAWKDYFVREDAGPVANVDCVITTGMYL
jgi:hypothetical protein